MDESCGWLSSLMHGFLDDRPGELPHKFLLLGLNLLLVAYEYKRLKPLAAWQNPFAK
jgi:hypothetical protein